MIAIAGKAYQEKRIEKRERRQPQSIPDMPYLNWEKTGQAPAGPYAVWIALVGRLHLTSRRP